MTVDPPATLDDDRHRDMTEGAGMAKSAADLVAEATARIENLRAEAVESELTSGGAILVDIRESDEFET